MICRCDQRKFVAIVVMMSTKELLHEIEALPKQEQVWLLEKLSALTEAEIPESFRQGMKEAEHGELRAGPCSTRRKQK